MNSIIQKSTVPTRIVLAFCSVMMLLIGVVFAAHAQASSTLPKDGKRLLTIHDGGNERGILTKATTLREAFAQANIPTDANDMVEPGLDEELVANNYEVNIYRARPVLIVDGPIRKKVMSPYRTAKQIADQAHITLQDEDTTDLQHTTNIVSEGAGVRLVVDRATPFTLVLYGKKVQAYTQATTVAEMLKEKDITIGEKDTLSVKKDVPIVAGMKVELWRNGKQTVTREEKIQYEVEQIEDADRPVGYKKVTTPGVMGKKTVTYEVVMKNGKEVKKKKIQSVVTKKAQKQVEIVGTKMTNTFSGDFAGALARLRTCEAGGNYANKNNSMYRGAYQYDYSTWANYKGYRDPADAPASVQDERAWQTYQARGWSPWPSCSVSQGLKDVYR